MPKVNVYLPDPLAEAVREAGLSVSPICQRALEAELRKMNAQVVITEERAERAAERLRGKAALHPAEAAARRVGIDWVMDVAIQDEIVELLANWRRLVSADGQPNPLAAFAPIKLSRVEFPTLIPTLAKLGMRAASDGSVVLAPRERALRGFISGVDEAWAPVQAKLKSGAEGRSK